MEVHAERVFSTGAGAAGFSVLGAELCGMMLRLQAKVERGRIRTSSGMKKRFMTTSLYL
jgi:hypothetical protein